MDSSTTTPSDPARGPQDAALVAAARKAAERAHAPYSGFAVGAAIACADGRIVTAANVENASYGLTICAERAAVVRALAEGVREFEAIAVACDTDDPVQPCGACRQFLAEFAPRLRVLAVGRGPAVARARLDELLPGAFRLGT